MEILVPINVNLIAKITGLPTDGINLENYLDDKMKEKSIGEEVKEKFCMDRGSRWMIIKNFNDPTTIFVMNLMSYKLLIKFHKGEALVGVVAEVA